MSNQKLNKEFQCDYKAWSTSGGSLEKLTHFNGSCKSEGNPKNFGFRSIFKCPYSKWESNNCLGTSFKTKEFADTLQKWFNLDDEDKTDERWIQLFNSHFLEYH